MLIARRLALVLAALAFGAFLPSASAGGLTCDGKPVTIAGNDGDNDITGTDGDDVIHGLEGNDFITMSKGNDTICGGVENDSIQLTGGQGVANLKRETAVTNLGTATVLGVENVYGTTGADEITGDSGANRLWGDEGGDTIVGLGGNDLIAGQLDNDVFSPGSGSDRVQQFEPGSLDKLTYRSSEGAISVTSSSVVEYRGEAPGTGVESSDRLSGTFTIVEGSRFDDRLTTFSPYETTLVGLGGDDSLTGGDANDTLAGGEGDDSLTGGDANDTLAGGKGDDTLTGGPGDDSLLGGPNNEVRNVTNRGDLVDYRKTPVGELLFEVDLAAGRASTGDGIDALIGIESATATREEPSNLIGDNGPNVLIGNHWYDELQGLGGNDLLFGARETDILDGGEGADYLEGGDDSDSLIPGAGDDTIVGGEGCKSTCPDEDGLGYARALNAVHIDLPSGTATTGAWGTDTFGEIEGAFGSDFDDIFIGDSGPNHFYGLQGSDTAHMGGGNDYCEAEVHTGCESPARHQRI